MSKRNGKPARHANRLHNSKQDDVSLAVALEERFLRLCGDYRRINGVDLAIPSGLDREFYLWRQMMVRFKKGDFRNSEAELKSVQVICQWTLQIKAELVGQETKTMEWRE